MTALLASESELHQSVYVTAGQLNLLHQRALLSFQGISVSVFYLTSIFCKLYSSKKSILSCVCVWMCEVVQYLFFCVSVSLVNAYWETICHCWLLNRYHCVFCSLIKFNMMLPVAGWPGLQHPTVPGLWHHWRVRTPWPNISELLYNVELIAKRFICFVLVLLYSDIPARQVILFLGIYTFISYFKRTSPASCLYLRVRWKTTFVFLVLSHN